MSKNICVYCSSSNHIDKKFFQVANELATKMAQNGFGLVYGGTDVGLMGELAKTLRAFDGNVIGIIPEKINEKGLGYNNCTKFIVTDDMRSRKELMEKHSDVFITLPGGFGTIEEISEMIVSKQLGYHKKPLIFLDVDGFYKPLFSFFEQCYSCNFVKAEAKDLFFIANSVDEAFEYINNYKEKEVILKW